MPDPLLIVEQLSKRFGVTRALTDVSCSFLPGEVHALMGENGAGKSTLGKAIAGLHKPDSGRILIDNHELRPGSIHDASAHGIRIVHQELAQCPNLSVAENLCLHDLPRTRLGLIDRRAMLDRAAAIVHRLEPSIDVSAPLGSLPPGHRQICQIAASLDEAACKPRVIVFDEPTSSLSIAEADRLLKIVRQIAAQGITVLYVSHRMGEIFAACDRVTVLRDGHYIATSTIKEIDEPTLVEQMLGRRLELTAASRGDPAPSGPDADTPTRAAVAAPGEPTTAARELPASSTPSAPPILTVSHLSSRRIFDISLNIHPGEILGIGGLVGAGRSEVLDAIFGVDSHATGSVTIDSKLIPRAQPRAMIRAGVGYVPEDRRLQGLFFQLGIDENIVLPFMPRLARAAAIRSLSAERTLVTQRMSDFRVKAASPRSLPGQLSGGNQQKLLIARWLGPDTRLLLLDEPTRGIDVGTKAEIYRLIRAAASRGLAVLLVSSEMPELLALSHRILVMAGGQITGHLQGSEMTQTNILTLATREHRASMPPSQAGHAALLGAG